MEVYGGVLTPLETPIYTLRVLRVHMYTPLGVRGVYQMGHVVLRKVHMHLLHVPYMVTYIQGSGEGGQLWRGVNSSTG